MAARKMDYRYFAVKDDDGNDCVMHAVNGLQPKDARPITDEEVKTINDAVTARSPKPVVAPPPSGTPAPASPPIDLTPIHAQLEALTTIVKQHAGLHDEHQQKLSEQDQELQKQAHQIKDESDKIRKNTAEAIAALTQDIGEKPA